jgi:NADPH2:quinone reductase
MQAIRVHGPGGPEVLRLEDVEPPRPAPGEVAFRVEAAGVNFIDVYHRTGLYPLETPFTPGLEAAGVVTAVGEGVGAWREGDRVTTAQAKGAYAQQALAPQDRLVRIPEGVEPRLAAAVMLQGMTAHYLVDATCPLQPGDACIVHAAAGGVGLLLVQMARARGARVFATVSTEAKARLAREAGADEVVLYSREDFEAVVRDKTGGGGVRVVYDSVGQATWEKSLRCLAPRGMLVLYGQSSGPVPPIDPLRLASGGSLFLTRPSLFHHVADRASLERRAGAVLGDVASGRLKVRIGASFALDEAPAAHRALEGRETTGKVLLLP